jgi:hypothetical protein
LSIGCGPQAKAWSAQASYSGDQLRHEAVVAERPVVRGDDVLDFVGQQARRIDVAALCAPNRITTCRPSRTASSASIRIPGHAQAAGDQQQVRLRGSTSNGRPSGPSMSSRSPSRARVSHSVPRPTVRKMERDDPVAGSAVLIENGRRRTRPE